MRIINANYYELSEKLKNRRIILFGAGKVLNKMEQEGTPINNLVNNIDYVVDNSTEKKQIEFCGKHLIVCSPEKLRYESDCVIILDSDKYASSFLGQLKHMDLDDSIDCLVLLFSKIVKSKEQNPVLKSEILAGGNKIPNIIHTFWFSGEKKPDSYQKCIDSWSVYCPDYKIIEWTQDNYDVAKNAFMARAIERKKWAYAADFARLDVLWQYGGVYLDGDVELIHPIDDLMGNKAWFSFDVNDVIDLASFASVKNNDLLREIMDLYENISFPDDEKEIWNYVQPLFIKEVFVRHGLISDGSLQKLGENVILPRCFFSPLDYTVYLPTAKMRIHVESTILIQVGVQMM